MKIYATVHERPNTSSGTNKIDKLLAILEVILVTFIATLIPYLIELGRPPTCIEEVWVPVLSSILAAIYTYMRIRDIESE